MPTRRIFPYFRLLIPLLIIAFPAQATDQVALVIGNSDCQLAGR